MYTLPLLLLAGCGYRQLQTRVAVLELELAALREAIEDPAPEAGGEPLDEGAIVALIQAYDAQLAAFEIAQAGETLEALRGTYPGSRAWQHVSKLREEYALIGQPAPPIEVLQWFTPPPEDAEPPAATLLVFWEAWCPYCREELPVIQERSEGLDGLEVIGLSRVSGSSSEEDVRAFIAEHGLRFAAGRDDGSLSEAFHVRGIPAAAIVEDGIITWRGHPGKLDWAQLARRLD